MLSSCLKLQTIKNNNRKIHSVIDKTKQYFYNDVLVTQRRTLVTLCQQNQAVHKEKTKRVNHGASGEKHEILKQADTNGNVDTLGGRKEGERAGGDNEEEKCTLYNV